MKVRIEDVRYAVRAWSTQRAVFALCVLCLSAAIGASTTVFTIVNGVLLQPLPFADPDRLLSLGLTSPDRPDDSQGATAADLRAWAGHPDIGPLAAVAPVRVRIADADGTRGHAALAVAGASSDVLGLRPLHGRALAASDDRPGAEPVALLGEAYWRQRFGADANALGQTIEIEGRARTIAGIMPGFDHPALPGAWRAARVWLPLGSLGADHRNALRFALFLRARDAEPISSTIARTAAAAQAIVNASSTDRRRIVSVRPPDLSVSPTTRAMIVLAMGAVTFVLVIACVNVANLLLVRASARRREIATRLALGASRGRIAAQLLVESLLLGLASIPLGLVIARWGRDALLGRGLEQANATLPIDATVLTYAAGTAVVTSVLFGLTPALAISRHGAREALAGGLRHSSAGVSRQRLRQGLAVVQVSLSIVLLIGTSLCVRSFTNLLAFDSDLDLSRLLTVALDPAGPATAPGMLDTATGQALERLAALPGVIAVSVGDFLPLRDGGFRATVETGDRSGGAGSERPVIRDAVSPSFFDVLPLPLVRGRAFTGEESRGRLPVAVISRRLGDVFWPDSDPIGKRLRFSAGRDVDWYTVVGVAADLSSWDISGRPQPIVYVPYGRGAADSPTFLLRTAGDPASLLNPVRAALAPFDGEFDVKGPLLMTDVHRSAFARQETLAFLFGTFGTLSILLTGAGVFGLLSYFVVERRPELGLRMALGADRRDVTWLVLRQAGQLVAIGILIGVPAAWAAARLLNRVLFEITATDPISIGGTAVFLVVVAIVSSVVPAYRAASIDPAGSLR
jgi:predicted permease